MAWTNVERTKKYKSKKWGDLDYLIIDMPPVQGCISHNSNEKNPDGIIFSKPITLCRLKIP
ncbi:MAG: hypothetical protein CM15mP104_2570 [Gammaproteobacteria bacterium]|nr:MAG: hypothetical protein CM15mP104_2570 [Gammaproteobacteria bacterium]